MGLWAVLVIASLVLAQSSDAQNSSCDVYQGKWVEVIDSSYPLYTASTCPFIRKEFDCQKNGRPDELYQKYKWQPYDCDLPRFDGLEFLKKFKGKSIMFVGDSLTQNQWGSFVCMLYAAVPGTNIIQTISGISVFTFTEFDVKVMLARDMYLVDVLPGPEGNILNLDSIQNGRFWKDIDVLVFNSWHWWPQGNHKLPWDHIQSGGKIFKDMNRIVAFEKALTTWGKWVDANVDPTKTKVFFRGISPSHYSGREKLWRKLKIDSCLGQKEPLFGYSTFPGQMPYALTVIKRVLSKMKTHVQLLDITNLSSFRKDGHPSIYGIGGNTGNDCTHWCLPGPIDTWNEILSTFIV